LEEAPLTDTLPGIDVPTVTYPPVPAIPYYDPDGPYLERAVTGALVASIRSGEYPHVAADGLWRHGRGFIDLDDLRPHLPVGSVVERTYESRWDRRFFVRGTDFVVSLEAYPDQVRTEVAATSLERAREVLDHLRDRIEIPHPPRATIRGSSWTCGRGADRLEIDRVDWRAIEVNYPAATREQLAALMAATAWSRPSGQLVFFHGQPGTGKTYALRALITQWEPWCRPEFIVDPDVAFSDSSYLTRLIGSDHDIAKSRLLVCEDLDDLITSRRTGGLERLLNLADGILGQGRNLIFLITTNARAVDLDAALLRPGRCMANIDFEHFGVEEARTRLRGTGRAVTSPMTLAELYEAEGSVTQVCSSAASPSIGTYL
jgi:hypothetical protein